jgi:hypothetical protein
MVFKVFRLHPYLLTSANHVFKVKEIMDIICQVNLSSPEKINEDCSILVKYLLETYSISNFDLKVVIEIAGSGEEWQRISNIPSPSLE